MESTLQLLPVKTEHIESIDNLVSTGKPFIEANTVESTMDEIRNKHIIPVYAKDNERLISIAEFVDSCNDIVKDVYRGEQILQPSIRLSHPIKGRIPEAKDKSANELHEWEKTLYYERAAFVIEIPSIQTDIDGSTLSLTVGGVKSYNLDKVHGKKGADEMFSFFVGFENRVCTNLCVWSDGYSNTVGVRTLGQLKALMHNLFEIYNSSHHLHHLRRLSELELTEHQFAQMIGRCRMYPQLPTEVRNSILPLLFGDSQINAVVRDYYRDDSFCRQSNGNISLWRLYNLFTGANKSSYIDSFLDRSVNAYNFVEGIRWELENPGHSWFLN
jgi:hypothetical protein